MARGLLPKLLCVDDDPVLLRSMRWLLRGRYEVAVAGSGIDALALLGGDAFDVLISDQRMPGMTGTELLEHARLVSPRTVRLFLTGYSDLDAVLGSLNECEVFRFIAKPCDNQTLLDTVDAAVALARATPCAPTAPPQTRRLTDPHSTEDMVLVFHSDASVAAQWRTAVQGTVGLLSTGDIAEALSHLTRRNVGVLITDIDDDGAQQGDLIRAVRRHLPQVAVLVHSNESKQGAVDSLISEGQVHGFIARPARAHDINRALQSALGRRSQRPSRPEPTAPSAWLLGLLS